MTAMIGATFLAAGCSLSQDGILPPRSRIFLPEGGLVDGNWLYVVNSNSDLRYNDGTLAVVDLQAVAKDREPVVARSWPQCPADTRYLPNLSRGDSPCCWDALDRSILNCDEQSYVKGESTIRIGSFGGRPVVHRTLDGQRRFLIPIRGNSSVTMVHVDDSGGVPRLVCSGPPPLRCGGAPGPQEDFAECTDDWRINKFEPANGEASLQAIDSLNLRLPDEPYGMAIDNDLQILYVGHLASGILSLVDLASDPTPRLVSVFGAAVPSSASGARGITSLTGVQESPSSPLSVFVTSRYRPVVTSVAAVGASSVPSCAASGGADQVGCTSTATNDLHCNGARDLATVTRPEVMDTGFSNGAETRGVAFSADRQRSWVLQRTPPAIISFNRTKSPTTGLPLDIPTAVTEVCANPAFLEALQAEDGLMLYVSCFDIGEIYVVSADENRVRDVIEVGRGPAGIVFDSSGAAPQYGYVLGFGANNVSVVDLRVGMPTRHRVIQRIGFPSPTPRPF